MRNSTKRLLALRSSIENVTETLADLSLEVDKIIEEENNNVANVTPPNRDLPQAELVTNVNPSPTKKEPERAVNLGSSFEISQRTVITNNYKGLRGLEGNVTGHSCRGKYTYIEDDNGKQHRKENHNLRRIA